MDDETVKEIRDGEEQLRGESLDGKTRIKMLS